MTRSDYNPSNNESGNFDLPDGYFQRSANSILNKIEWQEEHTLFLKLQELKNLNGFQVPESYFEINSSQLDLLQFPVLFSIQKKNPFTLPGNYFESSELNLFAIGLNDNADELSEFATLKAIPKQQSFQTDTHYFSASEKRITDLLQENKEAKHISIFLAKTWYAVAAVLVIALGFWFYNYSNTLETGDCGTIACLDKTDLIQTKTLENLETEDLYELVNPKKLEEHLNSGTIKKQNDVNKDSSLKDEAVQDLPEGI